MSVNAVIRLRNKLEATTFTTQLVERISTVTPFGQVQALAEEMTKRNDELMESFSIVYGAIETLRTLIQDANHESGADKVMARMETYKKILKKYEWILANLRQASQSGSTLQGFAIQQKFLESLPADQKQAPQNMNVMMVSYDKDDLENTIAELRLEVSRCEDERNRLNHTALVDVSEEIIEFLRQRKLM